MLSYREKQLLMVQKYLSDRTQSTYSEIEKILNSTNPDFECVDKYIEKPYFDNFNELSSYVSGLDGYNTFIRVEDILSKEEIEQLNKEFNQINDEFKRITKLTKVDIGFLFTAIALQVLRQIFQPKLDLESEILDKSERKDDEGAAKESKKGSEYKDKMDKKFDDEIRNTAKESIDKDGKVKKVKGTRHSQYYYAPLADIIDITKGVPYDAIKGTKKYNLGMSGNSHRVKTLGHDPVLGYLFGTCNILTNTMTLGAENLFETYHVKNSSVIAKGDLTKALGYSYQRFKESKPTVGAAVIKQFYHIKSDELSKNGISLPFLELFSDSGKIKELTDSFDYAQAKYIFGTAGKQLGYAMLIDALISIAHKLYMFVDEYKNGFSINSQYSEFIDKSDIKNIRTRKILLYSNVVATTSNVIVCGVSAAAGSLSGNPEMVKFGVKNLDMGGIILTIAHLFSDVRFITKVKKEFIESVTQSEFDKKLEKVENPSEIEEILADFNRIVYQK